MPACGSLSQYSGFRNRLRFYQGGRGFAEYANAAHSHAYRQIIDAVENMSAQEQEKLALFLSRKVFAISDAFRYQ